MFIERLEERRVMSSPYSITVLDPRKWMEIIQGNMEANGWGDYHRNGPSPYWQGGQTPYVPKPATQPTTQPS